jgi:hypothetical protein
MTSSQVSDWSNSCFTYSLIPEPDSDFTPVALMPSKFARLETKQISHNPRNDHYEVLPTC